LATGLQNILGKAMALVLTLLVVIAAGSMWYLKTRQKPAVSKQGNSSSKVANSGAGAMENAVAARAHIKATEAHKYHAVSIQFKDDACAAVKNIANQRFLTKTAPTIPLSKCDVANCRCNYIHYSDRREEDDDRRSMYSVQTELYKQTAERDRREKKSRRKNDIDH
jgi:hypothetical protein